MKKNLWQYVSWMLNESMSESEKDLITEPDFTEDSDEQEEQSLAGNVAGATTPLGTTATYPNSRVGHRKSPSKAAGDSFGGARPPKKKRK